MKINLIGSMPKNQKILMKVFADIAGTGRQKATYEEFLGVDNELGLKESELLKDMKKKYSEIAHECGKDVKILAALEEIINQIRAKEVVSSEIRLSLNRKYIYARSPFYRRGKEINDIRTCVCKTSDVSQWGQDKENVNLTDLLGHTGFRNLALMKLKEVMNNAIEKNVKFLNLTYEETRSNFKLL